MDRLSEAIERVQHQTQALHAGLRTGWDGPDRVAGGLRLGATHEWLSDAETPVDRPPLGVLIHLASRAMEDAPTGSAVVWIARPCWPHPRATPPALLERSIFVDAVTRAERLWAADLALRSPASAAVVADASELDMSASRRLQLAAGRGSCVGLLARPWHERGEVSAAWTRWRVTPSPDAQHQAPCDAPRWALELLRCKGLQPSDEGTRRWRVQHDHETSAVRVVPHAGHRPAQTIRPTPAALRAALRTG